jgi:glutamyl-tRNA synthetase
MLEEMGISPGKGLQPLRVALTGSSVSPPLFESMAALGKEKTLQRLQRARGLLSTLSEEGTA